ncbi:hypothetical protein [Microbacterium sp. KRD172]|uniref:hypothetical protein n=1 Tax=Microbacterium sp. KRD172 TaxID=2729727 RepID=UPI0019D0B4A1|nr:hypothetical protein [Microbacterium sp. KRD172]
MNTDLNTLLITLYVHLDDRILPAIGDTSPATSTTPDSAKPPEPRIDSTNSAQKLKTNAEVLDTKKN